MPSTRTHLFTPARLRSLGSLLSVLLVAAMFTGCIAVAPKDSGAPGVEPTKGPGDSMITWTETVPIVHLKGTPNDMGRQQGELLRERIRRYLTGFVIPYVDTKGGREMFDLAAGLLAEHFGDDERAEIAGIAAGAGIKPEDALLINTWMDVAAALAGREGQRYPFAGSLFAVDHNMVDEATGGLAGASFEVSTFNEAERPEPLLMVVHPERGKPYIRLALPGMIGALAGTNLDGVAFLANPVPGPLGLKPSLPFNMLCRRMLARSGSAEGAAGYLVESSVTTSHNVVLADSLDNVWAVECSAERVAIRKNRPHSDRDDGVHAMFCASHFVDPGMASQQVAPSVESLNRDQLLQAGYRDQARSGWTFGPKGFTETIHGSSIQRNVTTHVVFEPQTGTVIFGSMADAVPGRMHALSPNKTYGVLAPDVVR
ncbi:MAG: C45 family autoproteolytic acyltransferase/hydrolase [Planctomycetota bacterium]